MIKLINICIKLFSNPYLNITNHIQLEIHLLNIKYSNEQINIIIIYNIYVCVYNKIILYILIYIIYVIYKYKYKEIDETDLRITITTNSFY